MASHNAKFIDQVELPNGIVLRRSPRGDVWHMWERNTRIKQMKEFEVLIIEACLTTGIDFTKTGVK